MQISQYVNTRQLAGLSEHKAISRLCLKTHSLLLGGDFCVVQSHKLKRCVVGCQHVSSVFLVAKPNKIIFLIKILYPKRRISSYSILATIVSPNKNSTHVKLLGMVPPDLHVSTPEMNQHSW